MIIIKSKNKEFILSSSKEIKSSLHNKKKLNKIWYFISSLLVQVFEVEFAKYPYGQPDSSTQEELSGRRK